MFLPARIVRIVRSVALPVGLGLSGCATSAPPPAEPAATTPPSPLAADALVPSARLLVGRVIATDPERRFAFVELAPDAPGTALEAGGEWIARTDALQETARLLVSRQQQGRTVGTRIVSGQPGLDDEVVWLAP